MRHFRIPVVLLAALMLVAGCAGLFEQKPDPITVSADTAAIIGEQAVATNATYVDLCAKKVVAVKDCNAWSTFYTSFKKDYAVAHAAHKLAVSKGDVSSAQDAAQRLQTLSNQLVLYALYGRK